MAGTAAATFTTALLATTSTVVLHSNDSEVWGLHLLMSALVLRVALRPKPAAPWRLGLVLGLAVSHHLTAILLVPLVVGAAWPPRESTSLARYAARIGTAGLQGIAGSSLGLLLFATLMLGGDGAWRWGETQTLAGLLHHVSRADYGVLQLSLHQETVSVLAQWQRALGSVCAAFTAGLSRSPLLAAVMLAAVAFGAWRTVPAGVSRGAWLGLAGSVAVTVLGFPALHNIDPTGPFGAWILSRFDLMPLLVLVVPLAVALANVRGWANAVRRRVLLGTLALGLVALQLSNTARRGLPADDTTVERYAVDLLRTPTPGVTAIVFGTDDHRTFPVLFAQAVLGEGPDVLYVDASLLAHPWYRAWLRQRVPTLPDIDKPVRLMGAIWQHPTLSATPIYLANDFSIPSSRLDRVPEGLLWRIVVPAGLRREPPPGVEVVLARHRAAFARYLPGRGPKTPAASHPFTADLAAHYNERTAQLVAALSATGRPRQAEALAAELLTP
ncbi:MAG: hypothetical protein JKY37_11470 [Nannocystaceae bacterium]|nr:hypothetical protein [Nannocystaceae bacterium]